MKSQFYLIIPFETIEIGLLAFRKLHFSNTKEMHVNIERKDKPTEMKKGTTHIRQSLFLIMKVYNDYLTIESMISLSVALGLIARVTLS